jgi:hypothetical protein
VLLFASLSAHEASQMILDVLYTMFQNVYGLFNQGKILRLFCKAQSGLISLLTEEQTRQLFSVFIDAFLKLSNLTLCKALDSEILSTIEAFREQCAPVVVANMFRDFLVNDSVKLRGYLRQAAIAGMYSLLLFFVTEFDIRVDNVACDKNNTILHEIVRYRIEEWSQDDKLKILTLLKGCHDLLVENKFGSNMLRVAHMFQTNQSNLSWFEETYCRLVERRMIMFYAERTTQIGR